ncbi:MAG: hypothetical protein WAL38_11075, partial [Solirubrobacteraceae bacterium]
LLQNEMLLGTRNRLTIARWLRRTANRVPDGGPLGRRRELLLCGRVALVRTDLLALADLLERTEDPDPDAVEALRGLLRDGCDSPLYNADLHMSELRAALYYLRVGLGDTTVARAASLPSDANVELGSAVRHVPADPR